MSRGRKPATYADPYMESARSQNGAWTVHLLEGEDSEKIVRKVRREGFEAKALNLSTTHAILALRSTHALHQADPAEHSTS